MTRGKRKRKREETADKTSLINATSREEEIGVTEVTLNKRRGESKDQPSNLPE